MLLFSIDNRNTGICIEILSQKSVSKDFIVVDFIVFIKDITAIKMEWPATNIQEAVLFCCICKFVLGFKYKR